MSATPSARQAIAIVRVSTDVQDCERQRRDVAAAARVHHLKIVRTLELQGLSGTKMLSNAEVGRVLDDLSKPAIAGVIVASVDRLTRPGELGHLAIFDFFQRSKKLIWTAGQECDINTLPGFLTLGIQGVLSGVERMTIISRLKGGKETVRLRGGNVDSSAALPRGLSYSKKDGWRYVEPFASQIKVAFDLVLERRSWPDIAERIGWEYHETVRRTLRNTCWMGVRTYTRGRETPLQIPMGITPLISPERWQAAQAIMDQKHERWAKTKKPSRFLLSGLLTCSCGKPYYLRMGRAGKTRDYYFCSTGFPGRGPKCGASSIQTEAADKAVGQMLLRMLDPAFLKAALAKLQGSQPERDLDARKLARERAKLEAQRERLVTLVVEGTLTPADFKRQSERIEAGLKSLDALMAAPVPDALDTAQIIRALARAFARFGKQPFEKRRSVLREAITSITIDNAAIPSVTLNGGFLASLGSVNSAPQLRSPCSWQSQALGPRQPPR
jgi:DNA invertase Pin-like site-specific DNA recombinase